MEETKGITKDEDNTLPGLRTGVRADGAGPEPPVGALEPPVGALEPPVGVTKPPVGAVDGALVGGLPDDGGVGDGPGVVLVPYGRWPT